MGEKLKVRQSVDSLPFGNSQKPSSSDGNIRFAPIAQSIQESISQTFERHKKSKYKADDVREAFKKYPYVQITQPLFDQIIEDTKKETI